MRAKPVKADKHGAGLCILGGATQGPGWYAKLDFASARLSVEKKLNKYQISNIKYQISNIPSSRANNDKSSLAGLFCSLSFFLHPGRRLECTRAAGRYDSVK